MVITGVETAGIVLAIPGVVDLLFKYGEWISDRIQTFKNAKEIWIQLGEFGLNLSKGKLKDQVLLARNIYAEEGCDPDLKASLEMQLRGLQTEIGALKKFLEEHDPKSLFSRGLFAIAAERRAKERLQPLKAHQKELTELLNLQGLRHEIVPQQTLLSNSRFQHYQTAGYTAVPFATSLFVTRGDYKEDNLGAGFREISVLIEQQQGGEQVQEENVKKIADYLHYRLSKPPAGTKSPGNGILPCLGYRMQPQPELVFELPQQGRNPQTLQTIIAADQGRIRHPLDFRFRLARQLAEAVLHVHSVGLVHKNIRTETTLVFQPDVPSNDENAKHSAGFGDLYLTHWRLLRAWSDNSVRNTSNSWTEDIYRHPNRQGLQVEGRYNLGHDIYSLGVCLLEIGTWDVLVQTRTADGLPHVSELFRAAAKVGAAADPDAELRSKLARPDEVKNILLEMASRELPSKMGLGFTRLVKACLTGLDQPSGFGDEIEFRKMNKLEQGIAFKEVVLSFFKEMSI